MAIAFLLISPLLSPSPQSPLRFHCTQKILLSTCLSISPPSRSLAPPPCLSSLYKVVHVYRVDLTVIRTFLNCSHILLLFSKRVIRPTEMPSHECTKMSEIACFALKSSVLTLLALRASSALHHAPSCLCLPSYPFFPSPSPSRSCLSASPVRPSLYPFPPFPSLPLSPFVTLPWPPPLPPPPPSGFAVAAGVRRRHRSLHGVVQLSAPDSTERI